MIVKDFNISQIDKQYYVGINQIKIQLDQFLDAYNIHNGEEALNSLFKKLEELQNKHNELIIQAFKEKYVLNQDHIFIACYYLQKASFQESFISNKKNIELLLYLSTHRQIGKGIKSFGVDVGDLRDGSFIICIISPMNNLQLINNEILEVLKAIEITLTINNLSSEKINDIIKFYDFSEEQIRSVLNSYGTKNVNLKNPEKNLQAVSFAVFDLICERMALLNLEKIRLG